MVRCNWAILVDLGEDFLKSALMIPGELSVLMVGLLTTLKLYVDN